MQDFPTKEKNGRWACCREEAKGEQERTRKVKYIFFKKTQCQIHHNVVCNKHRTIICEEHNIKI